MRPNHEKVLSDDPAARQKNKTFHVVAALDDFDAQRGNLRDGRVDLMGVVSAVRPYEFEPGKAVVDFFDHQRRSIAVLHASRMDDDAQGQTLRIDQRVNFATLHLFAGVVAGQPVMTAPFSADLTD